jgi:signal transduction histidine kinase
MTKLSHQIKDRTVSNISNALFDSELVLFRIILGISEFFWFILLIWPGDIFDRVSFISISQIITQDQLAILFLLMSISQFYVIFSESFHSFFARFFAFFSALLWAATIISIFFSVTPPPAQISGEIALMFGAIWIWIRPIILCHGIQHARKQQ